MKEFLAEHSEEIDSAERRVRGEQTDWRIVGKHYVREDFLSFVNADKGTNIEAWTTKFLEALNNLGLPLDEMRAQGYDGASVMSDHVNGVQARIKQQNRKAVYIHCRAHVLNLCIVHSSKLPLIRNMKGVCDQEYHGYSSRSCVGFQVLSQKGARFRRTAHEQRRGLGGDGKAFEAESSL